MAVTQIEITQDNFNGSVDLLSIHNPLIFIISVSYTEEPPEKIEAVLYDKDNARLGIYNPIPYSDPAAGVRTFAFIADEVLRSFMESYEDYTQSLNALEITPFTKVFIIVARDIDLLFSDEITFAALHGSSQFSEHPAQSNVYNNTPETITGYENKDVYVQFYNNNSSNVLTFTVV